MAINGRLNTATLTKADGWAYLETRAARAWDAFCDYVEDLGYPRPSITAPDGAYRTFAQQVYWKKYWTDLGLPGNAATPGDSNHGWGTCVDIWKVYRYPRSVIVPAAKRFGFTFNVPTELWHMQHNGMIVAATKVELIEEPLTEEDNMILINIADGDARYGKRNQAYYALVTADGRKIPVSVPFASKLIPAFGQKNSDGTPKGTAYVLSYADWEAFGK